MTNLSSLYKTRIMLWAALLSCLGFAVFAYTDMGMAALAGVLPVALLGAALAYNMRSSSSLKQVRRVCARAARGDMEARIIDINDGGDIEAAAHNLNRMLDISDAFVREAGASLSHVSAGKFYRQVIERGLHGSFHNGAGIINAASKSMRIKFEDFSRLTNDFENSVMKVARDVNESAKGLKQNAQLVTSSVENSRNLTREISSNAAMTSGNVNTVAAASEQLSAAVNEIGQQIAISAETAKRAVKEAHETQSSITALSESANHIEEVLGLIREIAEQTNMLALNATIEAARAGDAGKGFAVVASEVKTLAGQTAKATQSIAAHISDMQEKTGISVEAIKSVGKIIGDMSAITSSISAAVEQQDAATQEISRNMQLAASGTENVSSHVTGVAGSIDEAGDAANGVLGASDGLQEDAGILQSEVGKYLERARAVGG